MKIESTFDDKNFEQLVSKQNEKNPSEVFPFEYEGKKYWVKKARVTKSTIFHKTFYALIKLDILLPVENKSSKETLIFETNKLVEFNKKGILSAKVIGRNNSFFVLEDCGKNVYHYLKNKNCTNRDEILKKTISILADIHNKKFYHGGAQIRNFTYFKNEINVIDLEDSFDKNIDLETLQFRDFLLFLLSLLKLSGKYEFDFEATIFEYVSKTNNKSFISRLKKTTSKLSCLIPFGKILKGILSKDANAFIEFLIILNNLEEK